jgi:hypothetical protein
MLNNHRFTRSTLRRLDQGKNVHQEIPRQGQATFSLGHCDPNGAHEKSSARSPAKLLKSDKQLNCNCSQVGMLAPWSVVKSAERYHENNGKWKMKNGEWPNSESVFKLLEF